MDKDELRILCESYIQSSSGVGGELESDRAKALDYYLGDMDAHLPHEEGRSGFVSRDVLDTVESVLPSLIKIFYDSDNAIVFKAKGPEDEQQAKLESEVVRHVFYEENDGFLTLYTFFKDALLSKCGLCKTCFEESPQEREEYHGLTPDAFAYLVMDPGYPTIVIEQEQNEDGTIDAVLLTRRSPGRIVTECIPPEEFGIIESARSPVVNKALFHYHKTKKTHAELIEMGYDVSIVDELPYDEDDFSEDVLSRRQYDDMHEKTVAVHKSMREIDVYECYVRVDANEDDVAETLKVTLAGETPGTKLLDVEEVDRSYIASAPPVINTHQFHGLSLADLVMDIQEIKSALTRGILDNTYLSNAQRVAANELVDIDSLLVSRAGGVVLIDGEGPPQNALMPLQHPPVPASTFGLLEYMEKVIKDRTGVGDEVMGLDVNSLANVNTGVMLQAYEMARMRIELMARILAEVGVKQIFVDIHELLCKNTDRPLSMKLFGQWQEVDPRRWKTRTDAAINVGIGNYDKQAKKLALQETFQMQMAAQPAGIVNPQNLLATVAELAQLNGLNPQNHFSLPPPPDPNAPPPPEVMKAMADMQRVQIEKEKLQIDMARAQIDSQTKQLVAQAQSRESELRAQMEILKSQSQERKAQIDEQSQIMNAENNRMRALLEAESMRNQKAQKEIDQQLEKYKADLSAVVSLKEKVMDFDSKVFMQMQQELAEMRRALGGLAE